MKVYYYGLLAYPQNILTWSTHLFNFYKEVRRSQYINTLLRDSKYWKNETYKNQILDCLEDIFKNYSKKGTVIYDKEIRKIFLDIFAGQYKDYSPVDRVEEYIIYEQFSDEEGNLYGKELITGSVFPIYKRIPLIGFLDTTGSWSVTLYIKPDNENKKLVRESVALIENVPANKNEIEEYLHKKGLVKKKFAKKINNLANKNTFSEEIVPYVEKTTVARRKKASKEISIMENIEYLLSVLKNKNQELYNQYKLEYEHILTDGNNTLTNTPININVLSSLEAKIEFAVKYNKTNTNNIMNYLSDLKLEYLENILTNKAETNDITIDDIDKITELFLKQKDDYSLLDQRNVLKDIALIYFLELYENKETIETETLRNSYINDYFKWIILYIRSFIDLGIISHDIFINFDSDITLSSLLEIIKRIEFNKLGEDNIKKLIKRI